MSSRELKFVVRFAVGDGKHGARSSAWRIWRKKDDIYVAPRNVAGMFKGSLHASGACHVAVTAERHAQMVSAGTASDRRQITTWQRRATPTDGFTKAVSILFAAEFLSQNSIRVAPETPLINPPEPGKAIVVDLLFARMVPTGQLFLMPNQCELGRCTLSTGDQFLIIAGLVEDFDAGGFRRFTPLQEARQSQQGLPLNNHTLIPASFSFRGEPVEAAHDFSRGHVETVIELAPVVPPQRFFVEGRCIRRSSFAGRRNKRARARSRALSASVDAALSCVFLSVSFIMAREVHRCRFDARRGHTPES